MSFYKGEWNKQYTLDEDAFEKIDTGEKAYWLGFISADGLIDTSVAYKLVINLQLSDIDHLYKFRDFLNANVPIKSYPHYKSSRATIRICRKKIVSDLAKFGVTANKTHKMCIPDMPEEFLSDFIRGVFDGDGSLLKSRVGNLRFMLYSSNRHFLTGIQEILCRDVGLRKTKLLKTGPKQHLVQCVAYHGNRQVKKIMKYLFKNTRVCLERKYKKLGEVCY